MSDFHHLLPFSFDPGTLATLHANDNADWASDLVTAFRVLREIRRGVLVRRRRKPLTRDNRWLRDNLKSLREIWMLLRDASQRVNQ